MTIGTVKGILYFRALMNFPHFLLFCLIWVKFGSVNVHENLLSDMRFLQLTLLKAHFTEEHKCLYIHTLCIYCPVWVKFVVEV